MGAAVASGGDDDVSGDVEEGEREEPGGGAGVCGVGERERVRPTSTAGQGEQRGGGRLLRRRQRAAAPATAARAAGGAGGGRRRRRDVGLKAAGR